MVTNLGKKKPILSVTMRQRMRKTLICNMVGYAKMS